MGLDINVYQTCSKCRKTQSYEVNRDNGDPFDITNEEQWKILERYFKDEIAELRKIWQSYDQDRKDELAEDMMETLNPEVIAQLAKSGRPFMNNEERERAFITHELKFDEDAFYFPKCEKCGKYLTVVCYSY